MIHPSYFELMDIVNKDVKEGEKPIISSRYSIVIATAKRARQLIAAGVSDYKGKEEKPLSVAVDELEHGDIHIIRPEEAEKLREARAQSQAAAAAEPQNDESGTQPESEETAATVEDTSSDSEQPVSDGQENADGE